MKRAISCPMGSPVLFENYLGKVVGHIPLLGYLSQYISSPPGLYVAIGVAGVLLGLCLLTDGGKKEKQKDGAVPEAGACKEALKNLRIFQINHV